MEVPSMKSGPAVTLMVGMLALACACYLVFLYGSWVQFQQDRGVRDKKFDEFLARIPVPPTPSESTDAASSD